jgi:hypothetical protein
MIRKNFFLKFLKFLIEIFYRLIGKYGFTNRVIDGISLTITNLTFAIKAQNFKASILVNEDRILILLKYTKF